MCAYFFSLFFFGRFCLDICDSKADVFSPNLFCFFGGVVSNSCLILDTVSNIIVGYACPRYISTLAQLTLIILLDLNINFSFSVHSKCHSNSL